MDASRELPRDLPRDEVLRAFGRPVTSVTVEPIDPELRLHSVTGGLFRVRADGDSLVLKIVRHGVDTDPNGLWTAGADPSHRNYWKREWLAFDSGLLARLPGPLRAPAVRLTTEHPPDEAWVWMEDVAGRTGAQLRPDDDYATIARRLGATQGAFASGRATLPDEPWLSRGWLRSWVDTCAQFVAALDDSEWERDPRMTPVLGLRPRVLALWDAREALLEVVDSALQTLVHC